MFRASQVKREPPGGQLPAPGPGPGMPPGRRGPNFAPGRFGGWAPELLLKSEELNELKQYLSHETAKEWDSKSLKAQRLWVRMMWESGIQRRISAKVSNVSDEELADFFEKHLTEKQKTELLSTSGELLHQNLIELYMKDPTRRGRSERVPGGGRGRGQGRGQGFGPGYGREGSNSKNRTP